MAQHSIEAGGSPGRREQGFGRGGSRPEPALGPRRDAAAFTLVEVLTVVAILALLLVILAPSFRRARGLARQALCAGNFRSVGQGVDMYCTDNKNTYPTARLTGFDGWVNKGWQRYGVHKVVGRYYLGYPDANVASHGNTIQEVPIWVCPSHSGSFEAGNYGSYSLYAAITRVNGFWINDSYRPADYTGPTGYGHPFNLDCHNTQTWMPPVYWRRSDPMRAGYNLTGQGADHVRALYRLQRTGPQPQ